MRFELNKVMMKVQSSLVVWFWLSRHGKKDLHLEIIFLLSSLFFFSFLFFPSSPLPLAPSLKMPRAKRNKEVTLSKVQPKGRSHKTDQHSRLQAAALCNPFCYLFSVGNMRNNHLKQVREYWKGSSLFYGMNGVARKALGKDREDEIVQGIGQITKVSQE